MIMLMDLYKNDIPLIWDREAQCFRPGRRGELDISATKIKWSIAGVAAGIIIVIIVYAHTNWYDTFIRWATGQ